MATKKAQAVLVTTQFRGVFFGYLKDEKKAPAEITISGCRNVIYWSSDCNGFLGLAAKGPTSSCKIGPSVPETKLYSITSVTPVDENALKAWERF